MFCILLQNEFDCVNNVNMFKMSPGGSVSQSEEYKSFRGSIPLKKITVSVDKTWHVYDTGPRGTGNGHVHVSDNGPRLTGSSPLLCLPPISGTADVFFKQCLGQCSKLN